METVVQQTQQLNLSNAPLGLWNSLSADVLVVICEFLISARRISAHTDIVALSTCCSRWRNLIYNNEALWKKLLDTDFPEIQRIEPPFALLGSGNSRKVATENLEKSQETVHNPHRSRYIVYALGEKNLRFKRNMFAYRAVPGKCYGSDTPKNCFVFMNSNSYLALLDFFSAHRGSCGHSSNHSYSQYYDPRARELISTPFAISDLPANAFGQTSVRVPNNQLSSLYGNQATVTLPFEVTTVRWSSNRPLGFSVSELGANFSRTTVATLDTKSTPYTAISHSTNQIAMWVNQSSFVEIYSVPSMKLQYMVQLYDSAPNPSQSWGRWINLLYFNHGFLVVERDYEKKFMIYRIPSQDPVANDLTKITESTSLDNLHPSTIHSEPDRLFIGQNDIDVIELDSASLSIVKHYKTFNRTWAEKADSRKLHVSSLATDQWKVVAGCGHGFAIWDRQTSEIISFFRTPHCIDKIFLQPSTIIMQYGSPSGLLIYDYAYRKNYEKHPVNAVVLPAKASKIDEVKDVKLVKIADIFQFAASENNVPSENIQCKRIFTEPTRRIYAVGNYQPVYKYSYNKPKEAPAINPLTSAFWKVQKGADLTESSLNTFDLILPTKVPTEMEEKPNRADVIYYTGSEFALHGTLTIFAEELHWNPITRDVEWRFTDLTCDEFKKIYKKHLLPTK